MNPSLPPLAYDIRVYLPSECLVFCKTKENGGWCSNMAGGYPIRIGDTLIYTSEALYQTFRFPNHPEVQREIISHRSPMAAKMAAKKHRVFTRSDWDEVRVGAMWWSLLAKVHNNGSSFGSKLTESVDQILVEKSHKDDFWGTKLQSDGSLKGRNVLGCLLMALRDIPDRWESPLQAPGTMIPDAIFLGKEIPNGT